MARVSGLKRKCGVITPLLLVGVLAVWVLASGTRTPVEVGDGAMPHLRPTGEAQLVSIDPMPQTDGEMCQWTTASASSSMAESLAQEKMAALRPASAAADT